jgi:hypothetical protein|tara:strand:+ start:1277 stop:1684 length:408 start_codon:yes stop_codon:yes gene_type:complete
MASTLKINTLTGVTTAGSIAVTGEGNSTTTNLQQGLAKAFAWVDHKTDNAIDNGFNTASLTDTSAGISSVNITNAMASASQVTGVTSYQSGTAQISGTSGASMTSTTACKFVTNDTGSTGQEDTEYGMTLHGDLA